MIQHYAIRAGTQDLTAKPGATTSGLRGEFPEDLWLQQIGPESYVGVPMRNAQGRTIGHLAVLHTESMEPTEEDLATLKIFAARGCAELERKQADEKLQKANTELQQLNLETRALLEINRAISHHLDRKVLFGALADSLQAVVPTDRFGILLPTQGNQLQGYILTRQNIRSEEPQPTLYPAEGTATDWAMKKREWYVAASRERVRAAFPVTFQAMQTEGQESLCVLPLISGDCVRGSLFFMAAQPGAYGRLSRSFMEQVAGAVAVALDDCLAQEELHRLNDELAARKIRPCPAILNGPASSLHRRGRSRCIRGCNGPGHERQQTSCGQHKIIVIPSHKVCSLNVPLWRCRVGRNSVNASTVRFSWS